MAKFHDHEAYAYDFRKGGQVKAPKKKAAKAAPPANDLTAAKRKTLASSTFGLPGKRAYPMPDKKHARLAKSGDSHALHVGNITPAQKKKIDAKANRILGE